MRTRGAYPVVGLAPSLVLGIVTLKSLEAINPDVEVGDIQDYVKGSASFHKRWSRVWLTIVSCDITVISVTKDLQQLLIVHEVFGDQNGTALLHGTSQAPKYTVPRLTGQVV